MVFKYSLLSTEEAPGFVGAEVELDPEFYKLRKKRLRKVYKHSHRNGNIAASLKLFRNVAEAGNRAEVVLLAEELPCFMRALIEHPTFLPISFTQQLELERGRYTITLTSQEPFSDFTNRLSAALRKLG